MCEIDYIMKKNPYLNFKHWKRNGAILWTISPCPRTQLLIPKGEQSNLADNTPTNQHLREAHMVLPYACLHFANRKNRK